MNKNLALLGIVLALLVVTYVFQEKRSEKEYVLTQQKGQLLGKAVTHLKLPHVEAEKIKGSWYAGKELLSHNAFNLIEKKLSEIKSIKNIEGSWQNFFPNPFSFEVNHEKWSIGDLSLDKQSFYISRDDKIYLAKIEGSSHQLTHDEDEIESIKLNELVSTLSKSREDLKETQLFRFYPSLPMEQIVVKVEGNLPFELNLKDQTTSPPPIKGVEVHKDLTGKFFSLLTQINLKEEIPYSEKLKFKKLGEINFIKEKETVIWELWLKNKNSADAIIIDTHQRRAFLMVGGTLKIFFVQLQDYWDKKVIPTKDFAHFDRTKMELIQGKKQAVVTVLNREPLGFEVQGYKVEQNKMEFLMQFIFNLDSKDQAQRVSLLSQTEKQQILSEDNLRIEIMGQELLLWRKTEELIVVNLTQGFKAHFNLLDDNFHGKFEDVLK